MEGLLIPTISTRNELDSFEFENIRRANEWLASNRTTDILMESFIRKLHLKMFGNIWKWAGKYRKSNKNIGVFWERIPGEIAKLLGDACFWVEEKPMPDDEIGAVFHYRLELIHPFPNGNGRHGRLMTDLLMERVLGVERFSWGGERLSRDSDVRRGYIEALRAVDGSNDYEPLIEFVRS